MKTKEQTRADERREKDRVRSMLEGYNPWGRPGGGAPGNKDHSEFSYNKTHEANDAYSLDDVRTTTMKMVTEISQ